METMLACSVFTLVVAGTLTLFTRVLLQAKAGSSQAHFLDMARVAEQRISACIQQGKAVVVTGNVVTIMKPGYMFSTLSYLDADSNELTVDDNTLVFDPDIWVAGDEETLCKYVRPIDGQAWVFTNQTYSPGTVNVAFHLGDSTDVNAASPYGTGAGYQGVEVRLSAAPRNLQAFYQ